ncbi:MAG TPA: hypothetical protein PLQ88_28805, partial [Blastocatellia bacterium]|nr:hypothetical protein [Blastocatellia bacterium]
MTQSGLSPIELLAIQYGIMSGIFPAQTVDVCAESYTVRDRRTGRALYTESGWLFHDELPTSVSDALAK